MTVETPGDVATRCPADSRTNVRRGKWSSIMDAVADTLVQQTFGGQ
jgi:hypothetical protein